MRPMTIDDVEVAEEISADAFHALDLRLRTAADPEPVRRADGSAWVARTRRLVVTDGPGCWVAEQDGRVVGIATSIRREQVWCLVTFAVRPGLQGAGTGARLLAAAEQHGAGCPRAMLSASADPLAARRYHAAGFALHPQLRLAGQVDRSALPVVHGVREGTAADRAWLDDLDRQHRAGRTGRTTRTSPSTEPCSSAPTAPATPTPARTAWPCSPPGTRRPPGGSCGSAWPAPRAPSWPPT